jgi:hypothetical protein
MSVMAPTGSACIDRFSRWAMAGVPVPQELDDLCVGIEHYQPEDLPEMIETLRKAEMACMSWRHDQSIQAEKARQQWRHKSIEDYLSWWARAEFFGRWAIRMQFLREVREFLEGELRSCEAAGGFA